MKRKNLIKETYLLLVIVVGLFVLSIYTTYSMFTANTTISNAINLMASLPIESELVEYKRVTIPAGEWLTADLNISNNTSETLYYGAWYQMIEPSTINENIVVSKYQYSANNTTGTIATATSKLVTLSLANNTQSAITIDIGIGYSTTSSLNLTTGKTLITAPYKEVTLIAENATITGGKTITNLVENGNFNTDLSSWSGGTHYATGGINNSGYMRITPGNTYNYRYSNSFTIPYNNTYYTSAFYKKIGGGNTLTLVFNASNGTYGIRNEASADISNWTRLTAYSTNTSSTNSTYNFLLYGAGHSYVPGMYTEWDNAMVVDLTEAYGTNAPSKAWVDDHITYFNGTAGIKVNAIGSSTTSYTIDLEERHEITSLTCTNGATAAISGNIVTVSNITANSTCNLESVALPKLSETIMTLGDTNGSGNNILKVDHPEIAAANSATGEVIPAQTAYRYYGEDPNNYVYYNCTDNSNTATCEIWRIIGVFDTYSPESEQLDKYEYRVKIRRQEYIGNYSWDSSAGNINRGEGIDEWSQADLKTLLNDGAYWNRTTGTCYIGQTNATTPCDFSNTGLTSGAKALTETARYYTAALNLQNMQIGEAYLEERGTLIGWSSDYGVIRTTYTDSTTVGLMYLSDYGYAAGSAYVNSYIYDYNYNYPDFLESNWLYTEQLEVLMSVQRNRIDSVFYIYGMMGIRTQYVYTARSVYPVLYLKSNVVIIDGTGTIDDPYVIGI